ncbi:MAG TPA: hypothetical protein VH642_02470 [Streptosporangiaceae bacterium]
MVPALPPVRAGRGRTGRPEQAVREAEPGQAGCDTQRRREILREDELLYPLLIERPWKKYASTLRTGT